MPLVNVRTILLYDRRHVRPDTLEALKDAKDGDVLIVDPTVMNAFTTLNLFTPAGDTARFKSVLLVSTRAQRPEVLGPLAEAKHGDMLAVDPAMLDAFTPLLFAEAELPIIGEDGKLHAGREKKKTKPKEKA